MSTISRNRLVNCMLLLLAATFIGLTLVQAGKMQFVRKTTSVKYVVPVVTSWTTVASTCYVTTNVTAECRKRRSPMERSSWLTSRLTSLDDVDVDDILPTLPKLEASTSVDVPTPSIDGSRMEIEEKRGWTLTARPLDGWSQVNRWISSNQRPVFGLTYVDVETMTLTRTTYSTVTDGYKTFVVSGCLPAGFLYTSCSFF